MGSQLPSDALAKVSDDEGCPAEDELLVKVIANTSVADGLPGLAVASPSRNAPNYYFHWVRDGALTIGAIIDEYERIRRPVLRIIVEDWIESSAYLQTVPNLSNGVGEPKFHVDGRSFNEPWGRPQNDGPALRALAALRFGMVTNTLANTYANLARKDLEYVSTAYTQPGFDLWEEVPGYHFFTALVQWASLKAGVVAARLIDAGQDDIEKFSSARDKLGNMIKRYWLADGGSPIRERYPRGSDSRSGLDAASLIGALAVARFAAWTVEHDHIELLATPRLPSILATAEALVDDFAPRFPVNGGNPGGIGRYPEDVYDGVGRSIGNPWFLCTAAVAETFVHNEQPEKALPLFQFIGRHHGNALSMSEQVDRVDGFLRGAGDLTWSYSAARQMIRAANQAGYKYLVDALIEAHKQGVRERKSAEPQIQG